jgi:superfamily II DNA or RNA helicase
MVAFYEPFASERAFVQQVGRVLRNPNRDPGETAYVVGTGRARLTESWSAYRAYDGAMKSGSSPLSPTEFARTQPVAQYFDRRFRTVLDSHRPANSRVAQWIKRT